MKLNKMTKKELEVLSYTDLTEMILLEEKQALNTPTIFKKICSLLELSDEQYKNQIGDFYTSLTTDKRFVLVDNVNWDLRDRHALNIVIDEDDDEDDEEEMDDSVIETVESEDIDEMEDEEGIDTDEDDMEDLTILNDDEMDDED